MQPKLSCYFASFCWKYYGFQQLPLINLYLEYAKTSVIIMSSCNRRRVWEKFARLSCYCDVDTCNSAESNLQAPTAKLRFDSHQSNFRRQAESWPKTTDAEINIHYITYQTALWFPRYNWTLHRWKAMESVMYRFRQAKPILFFQWVNLAWACNPIKNQWSTSRKQLTSMSFKLELVIWSQYWSADTLFWQVSINYNMGVQYKSCTL